MTMDFWEFVIWMIVALWFVKFVDHRRYRGQSPKQVIQCHMRYDELHKVTGI